MDDNELAAWTHKIEVFMENGLLLLGIAFMIIGAWLYVPEVVSVSTSPLDRSLPIYSVDTTKKVVSLTFDSAWGNEDLDEILAILDREKIRATFFFSGSFVAEFPEDVKKIADAGHDIANHGKNHKLMSRLSAEAIASEILTNHQTLYEITGREPDLFRPPSGDYNDLVVKTANDCGYYTIQWDVDSLDWKNYGAKDIVSRVVNHKNLQNGSIILLHNGTQYTVKALPELISALRKQGYSFVPVSKLIYREEYYIDHTGRQKRK